MAVTVNRLQWLDVMKAFAAFMVCFYHLTEHNQVVDFGHFENGIYIPSIEKALYGILSASVPLFFIANGVALRLKERTWIQDLYGSLKLIVIAIVWGLVCNVLIRFIRTDTISFSLSDIIHQPHYFWYLPSLAVVYLFDAVWIKIKDFRYTSAFFYLLLLFPFLSNLIFVILTYFNPDIQLPTWSHTGFFRLYSLVYVFMPVYFPRSIAKKYLPLLLLSGIGLVLLEVVSYSTSQGVIYDGVNASFPTVGAMLIALSIYQVFRSISNHSWMNFFSWLGRNCLGIYILHYPMIVLFNRYTSVQQCGWIVQFVVVAFIVITTGIITEGLKKVRLLL